MWLCSFQVLSHLLVITSEYIHIFSISVFLTVEIVSTNVATYMDYLLDKGQKTKPQNCV